MSPFRTECKQTGELITAYVLNEKALCVVILENGCYRICVDFAKRLKLLKTLLEFLL